MPGGTGTEGEWAGRVFRDRADAGRRLGARLEALAGDDLVVVGLPRGGVPVAFEVARALHAPLDVIIVRKLGVPSQPEWAMGALGEDGARVLNEDVLRAAHIDPNQLAAVELREREVVERRGTALRAGCPPIALVDRRVVVVDDGVATGSTVRAACRVARARGARRVIVAVPVGPPGTGEMLRADADEVVCLREPPGLVAVGQAYRDFRQVRSDEVAELLRRARRRPE